MRDDGIGWMESLYRDVLLRLPPRRWFAGAIINWTFSDRRSSVEGFRRQQTGLGERSARPNRGFGGAAITLTGRKTRSLYERYNDRERGRRSRGRQASCRRDRDNFRDNRPEFGIRVESLKSASPCATIVSQIR